MKRLFVIGVLLSLVGVSYSQTAPVTFLSENPKVDGLLDQGLENLQVKTFPIFTRFDNPMTDTIPVTYRMAYTSSHLYLYIDAEAELNMRRRGFINGDGFKLLLALPQGEEPLSDEYYDMAFSASDDKSYWARNRIWTYNFSQLSGKKFSEATQFESKEVAGKTGYETLIAWEDIAPYHPWFTEQIGYNLYFAKAIGDTITNGYGHVWDEGIFDEEIPKRGFAPLPFEKPETLTLSRFLVQPVSKHLTASEKLALQIISTGKKAKSEAIQYSILSVGEVKEVLSGTLEVKKSPPLAKQLLEINTRKLLPGNYRYRLFKGNKLNVENSFSIFPKFDFAQLQAQIEANPHGFPEGTVHTLRFKLEEVESRLKELKAYESGEKLMTFYLSFKEELDQYLSGTDPYADRKGKPYRRAFLSAQDQTYQPYTLKLPADYDPAKTYPLLVYLHGSGSDEQGVLNQARSGGNFIELAPFGRDKFQCYASEASQQDIVEAIEAVKKHYSVDASNIVIGGFSMGGYGALRTFYEHPELYQSIAVHAGHPNLASEWLGEDHPNFLTEEDLKPFKGKPVFIYHGEKDGALPVNLIMQMAEKLNAAGAVVSLHIAAGKGHEYPTEAINQAYFEWLNRVIEK